MPFAIPARRASVESASTTARSAPGGATATGRVRRSGATRDSTVVQKAGGSTKRMVRGTDLTTSGFGICSVCLTEYHPDAKAGSSRGAAHPTAARLLHGPAGPHLTPAPEPVAAPVHVHPAAVVAIAHPHVPDLVRPKQARGRPEHPPEDGPRI